MNAVSIDLTWLLTCLGVIVGGGAFPIALVLLWQRMSKVATIAAPWLGLGFGLVAWLVCTTKRSGAINVLSTGEPKNALAGNVLSLMTGLLSAVVLSFVFPAKYSSTDPEAIVRASKIRGTNIASAPHKSKKSTNGDQHGDIETGSGLEGDHQQMKSNTAAQGPDSLEKSAEQSPVRGDADSEK